MDAEHLLNTTARLFGMSTVDLLGSSRVGHIAEARQALAWALRQENWSLKSIGALLRRDHTTIIYSVATANRKIDRNSRFAERARVLVEAVRPEAAYQERPCCRVCAARIAELEAQLEALKR